MTISTKFNLGQEVWFMDDNRPVKSPVYLITLVVSYKPGEWCLTNEPEWSETLNISKNYPDERNKTWVKASDCHPTRESLIASL